jgi:hypothetical protein
MTGTPPEEDPRERGEGTGSPVEPGYSAWKRAKIVRGLAQTRDRGAMIPVEQVLRELKGRG